MLITVVVIVTALVASILAAFAGFGGAVIMLPVLVWAVGIQDAIPILTIAQLIGNLFRIVFNKRELKWPVIWRFALGVSTCRSCQRDHFRHGTSHSFGETSWGIFDCDGGVPPHSLGKTEIN